MTMMTANGSAYPAPVDDLLPQAQDLAVQLGELPSRNRLMRELRVGAPKADELRDRLRQSGVDWSFARRLMRPEVPHGNGAGPVIELVDEVGLAEPVEPVEPVPSPQVRSVGHPVPVEGVGDSSQPGAAARTAPRLWPLLLLAAPAMVAIWSGWVGLGSLTGFGVVHPLPGIWDDAKLNTAITLPIGVETYAAYAMRVWLSGAVPARARTFAQWSAIGSLALGAAGQVAYHLMAADGMTTAPWQITTAVSCLPVAVFGMGCALAHLIRAGAETTT